MSELLVHTSAAAFPCNVRAPQVILCDLGNVLVPFSHRRLLWNILRLLPWRMRWHVWRHEKAVRASLSADLLAFETGRCDFSALHRAMEKVFATPLPRESLRHAWNDIFCPCGATAAFLKSLHAAHPCYVLSNTNCEHLAYVRAQNPALAFVDGWVGSHDLHALKPAAAFYEGALHRFALQASDCVMIDDLPVNIAGAQTVGIRGLVYTSLARLQRELPALLNCPT